jgi:hypothetical protein
MASNTRFMPYPADAIFAVLADGEAYAEWVVGAQRSAQIDPGWPQPGSTLLHQQGVGPLHLADTTTVLKAEPPSLLRLEARVRPLVIAHVTISLVPVARGALVRMEETVVGGILQPVSSVLDLALHHRNARGLERLERLVGTRSGTGRRAAASPA